MGELLAGMGVPRFHSAVFFLTLLIVAVSWNRIFNPVSCPAGARWSRNKPDDEGKPCGAGAERRKVVHKETGERVSQCVCTEGPFSPNSE